MDIRYSCNQRDFKRYTTEEVRDEFLISGLYKADEIVAVYSHVDRMVVLGCMPVKESVSISKGIDVWANFGTKYFLERREIGIFNLGGSGTVVADGVSYHLNYKDCLYITQGNKEVHFSSDSADTPAKFYMVSAPAHCSYENKPITIEEAAKRPLGLCGIVQQAHHQPVHSPQRAENLSAFHGYDCFRAGQQLEHDAQPHARAPHGGLHLLRASRKSGCVPHDG